MKIVFIEQKGTLLGINTGYAYLAASLKKFGHEVKVIDFNLSLLYSFDLIDSV